MPENDRRFRAGEVSPFRRLLPPLPAAIRHLKTLLDEGRIGPLTSIRYLPDERGLSRSGFHPASWRLRPEESGGGLLWDVGSHVVDLLDHLFGPLENCAGESRNVSGLLSLPDQTSLAFTTSLGVPGECHWDFASEERNDLLEVIGERGKISASCFGNEALKLEIDGKTETLDRPNPAHVHQPLIQAMVYELLGETGACPSTGTSAARASRILDLIGHEE